jgi:Domain of unknown function (DUF4287)/Domain of unknown function (DUF5655)
MSQASDKPANMTERQEKWFASVLASMERETGKALDEWVAIAKTCPETKPNARKLWLKENYGIGANRAGVILGAAFPDKAMWSKPDDLRGILWADAASLAILEAVEKAVADLPGLIAAPRKGFTAFSRGFQFASVKPAKGGKAVLGLALDPAVDARLEPPKNEGWSERLKSKLVLDDPKQVDAAVKALLKRAWERS